MWIVVAIWRKPEWLIGVDLLCQPAEAGIPAEEFHLGGGHGQTLIEEMFSHFVLWEDSCFCFWLPYRRMWKLKDFLAVRKETPLHPKDSLIRISSIQIIRMRWGLYEIKI